MAENTRLDELRRRIHRDPASIVFAQLAEECRRAGQYDEAVAVCRAGLEFHPGYLSARVTLGRVLIELNVLDAARDELEVVLKSAPENIAAIRGLAEILHRQGSFAQALTQYRAALTLVRNDPELQRIVAELERHVESSPALESADGMSFERAQSEVLAHPPPPATWAATPAVGPSALERGEAAEYPEGGGARGQALRVIAVLEQWLDAIHVARAQPRP